MKTWKKALAGLTAMAICSGASVALTAAYLTDRDSEANIFTVGNVSIDLEESFGQGTTLVPGVNIEKTPTITNTGKNDAYVWMTYAIPSALNTVGDASKNIIHVNHAGNTWIGYENNQNYWAEGQTKAMPADQLWHVEAFKAEGAYKDANGTKYDVYTSLYASPLKVGDTTSVSLKQVYLDPHVDITPEGDWAWVNAGVAEKLNWNSKNNPVIYVSAYAIQVEGLSDADKDNDVDVFDAYAAYNKQWTTDAGVNNGLEWDAPATVVEAADDAALAAAIDGATGPVVVKVDGEYETNLKVPGGSDITIVGDGEDTVLRGQIATTSSTAGTLTLKNLTVKVDDTIADSTGISQTGKSAIALWGNQTVICENVTFDMSLANSTAITSWWDTGVGTSIIVRNCTFNCNGQRPIRATGNVTVENCTFNDPYRYAVQLTAKASTATELDKAIINFKGNTIVNGANGKDFVYGIQLEGADYGCNNCVINGSGNTIVDGGADSYMYYCECGKVEHATITWNTEVPAKHEV